MEAEHQSMRSSHLVIWPGELVDDVVMAMTCLGFRPEPTEAPWSGSLSGTVLQLSKTAAVMSTGRRWWEDTCGSAWLLIGRQLIGSMAQALDQGLGVTVIGNTRSRPWVRPKRGHGSSEKIQ